MLPTKAFFFQMYWCQLFCVDIFENSLFISFTMVNKRWLTAASWPVWKFYETAISEWNATILHKMASFFSDFNKFVQ